MHELGIVFYIIKACEKAAQENNAKSIKDAEADFEKTKLECSEITPEAYKKIPKYIRCIGWLFRIFAPLM